MLGSMEGNIREAKRRGVSPEACFVNSVGIEDRSMYGEGCRGTWEVPTLREERNRRASETSAVGRWDVRVPQ